MISLETNLRKKISLETIKTDWSEGKKSKMESEDVVFKY